MKEIPNIELFPVTKKQRNKFTCIPASVEAVLKYHNETVLEDLIVTKICEAREPPINTEQFRGTTFRELEKVFPQIVGKNFKLELETNGFPDFDRLWQFVYSCVNDRKLPVTASIPGPHAITILGCDENNIVYHDPSDGTKKKFSKEELRKLLKDGRDYLLFKPRL